MIDLKHPHTEVGTRPRRLAFAIVPLIFALGALGLWSILADAWLLDSKSTPVAAISAGIAPEAALPAANPDSGDITLASHESAESGPAGEIDPEERKRQLVVGRWQDEFHGKRYLTVRSDGTATMIVEPSGIGKKLFAERLEFEIEWTFGDGRIVMTMTRGEPRAKAQLVLKLYGREAEYSLLHLDDKQLLLLDADGETRYDWRRIPDDDRE
jgi:hypothetical protein